MVLSLVLAVQSWAIGQEVFDAAGGVDQSFTAGYEGRTFSENFHKQETYGPPTDVKAPEAWRWDKRFKFSSLYDGNVFSDRQDPKADMVYTYSPSVAAIYKGSSGVLGMYYDPSYIQYVENEKLSRLNHMVGVSTNYKISKLTFSFTDSFVPAKSVAVGERTELQSSESSRVTTLTNTARFNIAYAHSRKTTFSVDYGHSAFYFPTKENGVSVANFSTQTHQIHPMITYLLTPKTKIYTGYEHRLVDYYVGTGDLDSASDMISAGIMGKLTEKTGFTFDFSFLQRDYKHYHLEPIEGTIIKAGISRKITEKISATLSASRDTTSENLDPEKSSSKTVENQFFGVNLTWLARQHFIVNVNGGVGYILREGYQTQVDPENSTLFFTRENNDDFYQYDVVLNWTPKPFLIFSLGYYYFNKNSTFKANEYDTHRLLGTVEYKF